MARRVDLKDQSPLIIKQENLVNGSCAVCRCGLSGAWPMCDGTHKATIGEEPGKLYRYEREMPQGTIKRHEVGEVTMPGEKQADDDGHAGAREGRARHQRPQGQAKEAEGARGNAAGREGVEGTIGTEGQGGGRARDELVTGNAAQVTRGALATGGAEPAVAQAKAGRAGGVDTQPKPGTQGTPGASGKQGTGKQGTGKQGTGEQGTPPSGEQRDEVRVTGTAHDEPSQGI